MEPISKELDLLCLLHKEFSEPKSEKIVYARKLKSNKAHVEKAIYRLSNLGIISDWTVDDFFNGIFTVTYTDYSNTLIQETLLSFIKKYIDDFEFDKNPERLKYTNILNDESLDEFRTCAKVLLQWSYDKFGANRRESLKHVYYNCLEYDDSIEGRNSFKKSLEAYFKFTEATYILQHIAEHNNKDHNKWFEVFYDMNNEFISKDALIDLHGNLQRFLESYQMNTGLNLINGLTVLLLNKELNSSDESRFSKAFKTIGIYEGQDYDYILDQIRGLMKSLESNGKNNHFKIPL